MAAPPSSSGARGPGGLIERHTETEAAGRVRARRAMALQTRRRSFLQQVPPGLPHHRCNGQPGRRALAAALPRRPAVPAARGDARQAGACLGGCRAGLLRHPIPSPSPLMSHPSGAGVGRGSGQPLRTAKAWRRGYHVCRLGRDARGDGPQRRDLAHPTSGAAEAGDNSLRGGWWGVVAQTGGPDGLLTLPAASGSLKCTGTTVRQA